MQHPDAILSAAGIEDGLLTQHQYSAQVDVEWSRLA